TGGEPAITNLVVGHEYYVIVTAANQIRLAESRANAIAAIPIAIDIGLPGTATETTLWMETARGNEKAYKDKRRTVIVDFDFRDGLMSGTAHSIDPLAKGISITAKLEAENNGKAKSGLGSEPKIKDFLTKGELRGAGGGISSGIIGNLMALNPKTYF